MTPHTHALHVMRAEASPVLKAIMADNSHPAERLRIAAAQLDAHLVGGAYTRLTVEQRCDLRGLVFMLHDVADKLAEPAPQPVARSWWRFWG